MARHRFNRVNHLLVGDFVGGAEEAGVAAIHEDGPITVGVAAQGTDQLTPLRVVKGTEIQDSTPNKKERNGNPSRTPRPQVGKEQIDAAIDARFRLLRLV